MDGPSSEPVRGIGGGQAVLAPAKINLALHVTGRRADGYHTLDSLVVFAGVGDRLAVEPAAADRLRIEGPFAAGLPSDRGNIVLRALDLARALAAETGIRIPPLEIRLDKRLPVASGIGGGSADAAALLRLLGGAMPDRADALRSRALQLGADVPMCLDGRPARVSGVGERSAALGPLPALPLVLVNPLVPVSTPAVFAALEPRDHPPLPAFPAEGLANIMGVARYLAACRNDLEAAALRLAPAIADAKTRLEAEGAVLARMSGSGATVFGLFASPAEAATAAARIAADRPAWWAIATAAPTPPEECAA